MSYSVVLETDTGKQYPVRLPEGFPIGKALLHLATILQLCCVDSNDDIGETATWCRQLEQSSRQPLCMLVKAFLQSCYMSVDDGDTDSQEAKNAWVPVSDLFVSVSGLVETFRTANLKPLPAAEPEVILPELDALKSAVELALLEPVSAARITFF